MLFIQAAHAADASTPSMIGQFALPILFFVVFYFLIIRPQSKRTKEHKKMVESISVSDEIVFAGGLMGRVKSISGDYAVVSLNHNNDIKIQKSAVLSVLPKGTMDNLS